MTIEVKRVPLRDANLSAMAEAVRDDKEPRVLEQDGKPVAALISMEDLERLLLASPSREGTKRALSAAGSLSDEEGAAIKDKVYKWRHEAPPSHAVNW